MSTIRVPARAGRLLTPILILCVTAGAAAQSIWIPSPQNQEILISRSMAASVPPAELLRRAVGVYTLSFVARADGSSGLKLERGDPANVMTIRADGTFVFDHAVEIGFAMGNGVDHFPPGRRTGPVRVERGAAQRLELAHQFDPVEDPLSIGHAGYASKSYDGSDGQRSIFESDLAAAKALGAIHREAETEFLILRFYTSPLDEIWFFVKTGP